MTRLAGLDHRILSGHQHSLGPGGASALFAKAVDKALVDELAEQMRAVSGTYGSVAAAELAKRGKLSEIGQWAVEIIATFRGE
jgi:hypothetical protein